MDKGPWRVHKTPDGKISVLSHDFDHDVMLVVDGDFAEGDKEKYAEWLAGVLTAAGNPPVISEAEQVLIAMTSGEWEVVRILPHPSLTDEYNTSHAWSARRLRTPYCDYKGNRVWHGPTAFAALQAARDALGY